MHIGKSSFYLEWKGNSSEHICRRLIAVELSFLGEEAIQISLSACFTHSWASLGSYIPEVALPLASRPMVSLIGSFENVKLSTTISVVDALVSWIGG